MAQSRPRAWTLPFPPQAGRRCQKWGEATAVTLPTSVTRGSPRETSRAHHPQGTPPSPL